MARIGVSLVGRIPMKELVPVAQEADQRSYHCIWLTAGIHPSIAQEFGVSGVDTISVEDPDGKRLGRA